MEAAEPKSIVAPTSSVNTKRHRRKLSKDPPKNFYKKHSLDSARPTSASNLNPPAQTSTGFWSSFRRGKASVGLNRNNQQHLGGLPPRGDADTYGAGDEDLEKWTKELISGITDVRVKTPNKEDLPKIGEGESHFVLAADRMSAVPSEWAKRQLAAQLLLREKGGEGAGALDELKENKEMSESREEGLEETRYKLEGDGEATADDVVSPISASERKPSYLDDASDAIDDVYAPADIKHEVAIVSDHKSPAPEESRDQSTKILPTQHHILIPDAPPITADEVIEDKPIEAEQEPQQIAPAQRDRSLSSGSATILLRYSRPHSQLGDDKRKSTSSSNGSQRSRRDSPAQLRVPDAHESFMPDPSPVDPEVMSREVEEEIEEDRHSSPTTPTIATFGVVARPRQIDTEAQDAVPRSVPDGPLRAEELDDVKEVAELEKKDVPNNDGEAATPQRPKMRSMDTTTTIDVDRSIPGSIF